MRKVRFAKNDDIIGDQGDQRTIDPKERRQTSNETFATAAASDESHTCRECTNITPAPVLQQQELRNGWLLDLSFFTELLDTKITNAIFRASPATLGRFGIDIMLRNMIIVLLGYRREDVLPSSRCLGQLRILYDKLGAIENNNERDGVQEVIKMLESADIELSRRREKSSSNRNYENKAGEKKDYHIDSNNWW